MMQPLEIYFCRLPSSQVHAPRFRSSHVDQCRLEYKDLIIYLVAASRNAYIYLRNILSQLCYA